MKKTKSNKFAVWLITTGALLMISALLLLCFNEKENAEAGKSAEKTLLSLHELIKTKTIEEAIHTETPALPSESATPEMQTVMIDGEAYIGMISIPSLGLELPVMADWDYTKLKKSPCRQTGSVFTDDLVIAAHNYKRHFGRLKDLEAGAELSFTDVNGEVFRYKAVKVETVSPESVEDVLLSAYPLVLYTCTYGGKTRVAAFFERIGENT